MLWRRLKMRLKNDIYFYILILFAFSFTAYFTYQLYILLALLFSLAYLPLIFSLRNYVPLEKREKTEKLAVGEDILHFRETVDKALKGSAVAQRDIELRLLNSFVVALSVRYDLPESYIRRNLDSEEILRKYVGDKAKIIAAMYRRRHELTVPLPRERFVKEIRQVMEAME